MKRILLIIGIVVLSAGIAFSQAQLKNFKAKVGFTQADSLLNAKSFPKPELLFVGSMKQIITVPVLGNVQIQFNLSDGTSNGWVYLFRSGDNHDTLRAVIVLNPTLLGQDLGFRAQEVSVTNLLNQGIKVDKEKSLAGINWTDSDIFAEKLRGSSEFTTFLANNPDPDKYAIVLLVNTEFPYVPKDLPYWAGMLQKGTNAKACAMQAVNLDFSCSNVNSVVEENNIQFFENTNFNSAEIFPNPSETNTSIYLNLISEQFVNISISNLVGDYNKSLLSAGLSSGNFSVPIPTEELNSGVYFITIKFGNQILRKKFIVR